MLSLHPVIRLLSALLFAVAVFKAQSIPQVLVVYWAVLLLVLAARVGPVHVRFVGFVTTPLLIALLAVWGWAADARQIPLQQMSGVQYAVFCWLRIIAAGGILQFLLIPLTEQPTYLKDFLERTRLRGSKGTLIVASILFLPEVRRRIERIIDARKAQGHTVRGFKGLLELPQLLMPLVSSLLESASKRAELWSHRGILESATPVPVTSYSNLRSGLVLLLALGVSMTGFLV